MSVIKANNITNVSGGIPTVKGQQLIPTAWVNFNGTSTVAIRASENVSSITDVSTGVYNINFAVPQANVNYCPILSCNYDLNDSPFIYIINTNYWQVNFYTGAGGTYRDMSGVYSAVIGGQA